jgi:hypothetical protein
MRLVDALAEVGLPAAGGLATTWLELAQAEQNRSAIGQTRRVPNDLVCTYQ